MIRLSTLIFQICLLAIFSSILLVNVSVGSYTVLHLWIFAGIFLAILFSRKYPFTEILKLDAISISILVFALVVMLSYFANIKYYRSIEVVFQKTTGNTPSVLYFKIILNGLITVLVAYFSYRFGKTVPNTKKKIRGVILFIVTLFFINSFVNLISWVIETGGSIGRYNFMLPITGSPGISIQYSTLGFMLALPLIRMYRGGVMKVILIGMAFVLLSNILIIITRQNQVMFFLILFLYFLLINKISITKLFFIFLGMIITGVIFWNVLLLTGNADIYLDINSTDATDIAVRFATIQSSWEMFIANPWLGVGYGMFAGHNLTPVYITGVASYLGSAHNGVLSIASELGVIGLIVYITLNIIVLNVLHRNRKAIKDIQYKRMVSAIFAVQLVLSGTFLISNSHLLGPPSETGYLCYSFLSWFLIGLSLAIKKIDQQETI